MVLDALFAAGPAAETMTVATMVVVVVVFEEEMMLWIMMHGMIPIHR